jgi:hypothetical protein
MRAIGSGSHIIGLRDPPFRLFVYPLAPLPAFAFFASAFFSGEASHGVAVKLFPAVLCQVRDPFSQSQAQYTCIFRSGGRGSQLVPP